MSGPNDYHRYFIQDGKFIGAFEEMYQKCSDPWHQDARDYADEDVALSLIRQYRYRSVLDLGCGRGKFTRRLKEVTAAAVTAIDISPTAAAAGRVRSPDIAFLSSSAACLPFRSESFDLLMSGQLFWCVVSQFQSVLNEAKRVLRPGGHWLIVQTFYAPGKQKVGNELMTCPEDLVSLLPVRPLNSWVELDRQSDYKFVLLAERLP